MIKLPTIKMILKITSKIIFYGIALIGWFLFGIFSVIIYQALVYIGKN